MVKRADHMVVKRQLSAAQSDLRAARAEIAELKKPKPAPPKPFVMQVPVAPDLWVRVEATRPLGREHWRRLHAFLALQREIDHSPEFVQLVDDEAAVTRAADWVGP